MYIIHCLKEKVWNDYKNQKYYGEDSLIKFGFSIVLKHPPING